MNLKAIEIYLQRLKSGIRPQDNTNQEIHDDADIADYLEKIKQEDEEKFFEYLNSLPLNLRAKTFIELPTSFQIDLIVKYDAKGLRDILEELPSDEATDLFIAVSKTNKDKEEELFTLLSDTTQKNIEKLIKYDEDEAGALMQTEIFKISKDKTIKDAIEKLAFLKTKGIGSVQSLFVIDEIGRHIKTISLDDLIILDSDLVLGDIVDKFPTSYSICSHDSVDDVLLMIEKYDLTSLAVVDRIGHLIGRITHDDVVDTMQNKATQQIYNLNKIDEDEQLQESFSKTSKARATWLTINLVNAIIASMVIGVFEQTLEAIVALAVLMPIVANMAGTASVQTMTVIVRQMTLGQIEFDSFKPIFKKEMNIALLNGILFAVLTTLVSQVWFSNIYVSIAIGLSMFVSFVFAGLLGTVVPLVLKKASFDPAVASSVIVITLVDIVGFFSFLWFAKLIAL